MTNISVRKIDDKVIERLKIQAAQHGVSMEEEVRQILENAVSPPKRLGDVALQYFGGTEGVDLELPTHQTHEPLDLLK